MNEADEEVEDKIDRWESGEVVNGIRDMYKGPEVDFLFIRIISANRTE